MKKKKFIPVTRKMTSGPASGGSTNFEKKKFYYKVFYTKQINKKHKNFSDGILELERKVDKNGQLYHKNGNKMGFKKESDLEENFQETNSDRYLAILGQKKEIQTISLQVILKSGKATLYNENGKKMNVTSGFVADFNPESCTYRGKLGNLLVEFEGDEDVWDFEKEDFDNGKCFMGQVRRCQHSYKNGQMPGNGQTPFQKPRIVPKKRKQFKNVLGYNPLVEQGTLPEQYLCKAGNKHFVQSVFIPAKLYNTMMPHQIEGVKFMFNCLFGQTHVDYQKLSGCILADFMGLGKTLQTIVLIAILSSQNPISLERPYLKKTIIVAPVSLLGNWQNEFNKWLGSQFNPIVARQCHKSSKELIQNFAKTGNKILIVSYETFLTHKKYLYNMKDVRNRKQARIFDLMVCDEGHKLKNSKNKIYESLINLQCRSRIIVTGTPIQNNLVELYSCIKFIYPTFEFSPVLFKEIYIDPITRAFSNNASEEVKNKAKLKSEGLSEILGAMMLRRTWVVLQKVLPPRNEFYIFLRPTIPEIVMYNKAIKTASDLFRNSETDKNSEILAVYSALRKLVNHPYLITTSEASFCKTLKGVIDGYTHIKSKSEDTEERRMKLTQEQKEKFRELGKELLSGKFKYLSAKFKFIDHLLKSSPPARDNKIIIVSYYTSTLDLVEQYLNSLKIRFTCLTGKLSAKERDSNVKKFLDTRPGSNCHVFLLGAKAGGAGLNLVECQRMVMMDADWNPGNDKQVVCRI